MLLKQPNEITSSAKLVGLFYGQPGVGKTTIALSAPNPVIIDTDKGLHRVKKQHQCPALQPKKYDEVRQLINSNEVDEFDTIVIDTLGALVDLMLNASSKRGLQKWGDVKEWFASLIATLKAKGKHIIFVAHELEKLEDDITKKRIDVAGSSGRDLLKHLDFMAYLQMGNKGRVVNFNPTDSFYAKNTINAPNSVAFEIEAGNTFFEDVIMTSYKDKLAEEEQAIEKAKQVDEEIDAMLEMVDGAETLNQAIERVKAMEHINGSKLRARNALMAKAKELELVLNKETKLYEAKEEVKEDE